MKLIDLKIGLGIALMIFFLVMSFVIADYLFSELFAALVIISFSFTLKYLNQTKQKQDENYTKTKTY